MAGDEIPFHPGHKQLIAGFVSVLVGAVSGGIGVAVAQDAAPQSGAPALEEIVVTATKRSESLQNVPFSVQALGEAQLEKLGATDFAGYARSVPSLSFIDRGPGQQQIVLRGVASSTAITNTDQADSKETVAIYFDETPVSLNGFNPDLKLVDVDRIEILKGPQGTLFGAGSLSGTVRIITRKPQFDATDGMVEVDGSRFDHGAANYAVSAAGSIPLVEDRVALRATGYSYHDGGFIDNVGLESNQASGRIARDANTSNVAGGRLQLRVKASDVLDLNLKLLRQQTHLGGNQNEDAGLPPYQQSRAAPEPYDDTITITGLDAKWTTRGFDVISASSYVVRNQSADIDFTSVCTSTFGLTCVDPLILANATRVKDFIQEVRLVSNDESSRLRWIAGAFYDDQQKEFSQDLVSNGISGANGGAGSGFDAFEFPDDIYLFRARFKERQFALFGEGSVKITTALTATVGLRYFDFDQRYNVADTGFLFGGSGGGNVRTQDHGFDPKFNLSYAFDQNHLLYLQAAKGFRLGGPNTPLFAACDTTGTPDSYRSDSLWNYEIGSKNTMLGNRLRLNGSIYHIDWKDVPIAYILACGNGVTLNVAGVRVNGAEFDATVQVSDHLALGLGSSYTDSTFTSALDFASIVKGERTPAVPRLSANLWASYEAQVNDKGLNAYGFSSVTYVGDLYNYAGSSDPRRINQPGYSLANIRAGIRSGPWDLALYVNNVTDRRADLFLDRILATNRPSINRPRTVGINLKWTF